MKCPAFTATKLIRILSVSLILLVFYIPTPAVVAESALTSAPVSKKAVKDEDDFTEDEDIIEVSDPWEGFNRAMFSFNDKAYVYVLKPVAVGFRTVVPEKARVSMSNFLANLAAPIRIVNATFQLRGEDATNEFARLLINTTFGLGGLFDVAKDDFGINIKREDFGQTLGHYGIGNGPYLVLPLFGPTTVRDGIGRVVDSTAFDPLTYIYDDESTKLLVSKWIEIENELSLDKDTYEAIKRDSIDPYIFLRNAYIQFRAGAVAK